MRIHGSYAQKSRRMIVSMCLMHQVRNRLH